MPITSAHKLLAIYLLSLAIALGVSYPLHLHFDLKDSVDARGYVKMANGDYTDNPYRRNRPVVPLMAAAVAAPIQTFYDNVWPHRLGSDWPLKMAFLIVNALIFAGVLTVIFQMCIDLGTSMLPALLGLLAVAASRWTPFIVGLPMTDSLFMLAVSLSFYGIWCKRQWPLLIGISMGLLSKEAFILFLPIFFFFGLKVTSFIKVAAATALSVALAIVTRLWVNSKIGDELATGISTSLSYLETLSDSLYRLLSINGVADLAGAFGLFWVVPIMATLNSDVRRVIAQKLGMPLLLFVLMVVFGAMLAGDISRMIYMSAPAFAAVVALTLEKHPVFRRILT